MSAAHSSRRVSIGLKIDLALLTLFVVILIASSVYQFSSQRAMVEEMVFNQAEALADAYFDNVNTLMLTGKMAEREIARTKISARPEVLDARILRGETVSKLYGPGFDSAKPQDDIDRLALRGEKHDTIRSSQDGRILTVTLPLKAERAFRGTNCLSCHPVEPGTVLGAVRLDYSLKQFDQHIASQLWTNLGLNTLLLLGGLVVISVILKRLVTGPLKRITHTIAAIDQHSDLTQRIDLQRQDELGELATGFNRMMDSFSGIVEQLRNATFALIQQSAELSQSAHSTIDGAEKQHLDTDLVATAITQMEQAAHEVAANASNAAHATEAANHQVEAGSATVETAIVSIETLANELGNAAASANQLRHDSDSIGKVIGVISGIAEQTNLLALNAAIEAARAGEQGRGFAVVADEVRALATRTHESTVEIQKMIESLQHQAQATAQIMLHSSQQAQQSVDETTATGHSLGEILDSVGTINTLNLQNAAAAEQQQQVVAEINRNVVSINAVADATAASARQMAVAIEQQRELTTTLQEMIEQFKTAAQNGR
ncbi:MAG TPA: methyl-accepting chemotaxis protein [Motiliproteus sp.]